MRQTFALTILTLLFCQAIAVAGTPAPLPSRAITVEATALLQTMVTNPRAVEFTCPDHDKDDQHELDIIASDGTVIQTMLLGDPAADPTTGVVHADINVQPVAFGTYTVVLRAVAGTLKSENSLPSDPWVRAPGAPSKAIVK